MLKIDDLSKTFEVERHQKVHAVQNVSLDIGSGEFFTLLGPSGSGKSTLLRMIAGLEMPDSGSMEIDGRSVYSHRDKTFLPPNRRKLGMVFQSYAIWPHMSVYAHVVFPLKTARVGKRLGKREIDEKVGNVLRAVSLDGLENRNGAVLSGGQQQRLALARAIVSEPKLILLDEPLSNLDAKLRDRMRGELKRLQAELGLTFLYVTHDQSEALALSHRIAVMHEGRIQQIGKPGEIYDRPANAFVAKFIGKANFIDATIPEISDNANLLCLDTSVGTLQLERRIVNGRTGTITLLVRPEDIDVHVGDPIEDGWLQCTVLGTEYFGSHQKITLQAGDVALIAQIPATSAIKAGTIVHASIDPERIVAVS